MADKKKICPLLTMAGVQQYGLDPNTEPYNCVEHRCAWWSSVYTTERAIAEGCALEIKTHLNSDGLYIV